MAAGKGVVIANTKEEASRVAGDMLARKFVGEAGAQVIVEELLRGDEESPLA